MVRIFFCKNSPLWSSEEEKNQLASLPEDLGRKISQYQKTEDRQIRIRSKLLLLESLKKLGFIRALCDIKYDSFGKPFFIGGPNFNLSHSGDIVTCIVSADCHVGIDTEVLGGKDIDENLSLFPADVLAKIRNSPNSTNSYLEFWTKYEAAVKASGKGLYVPVNEVEIDDSIAKVEGERWFLKPLELSDLNFTTIATSVLINDVEIEELVI